MTQRGVSSAAIIDSVACAVKLVVEEVFGTADGSVSGHDANAARSLWTSRDEFLKENGGPG